MSGEQVSAADYDLITTKEGDMEILVAGTNLKVPEDLPRLSQLVSSTTLVVRSHWLQNTPPNHLDASNKCRNNPESRENRIRGPLKD